MRFFWLPEYRLNFVLLKVSQVGPGGDQLILRMVLSMTTFNVTGSRFSGGPPGNQVNTNKHGMKAGSLAWRSDRVCVCVFCACVVCWIAKGVREGTMIMAFRILKL